jgi:dipeptidyl aminopeptidase/acylaminoacyl peptidase
MYSMIVKARDGKELVCYYTLPKEHDKGGCVDASLPLVVVPHGGPFKVRDKFRFNP